MTKSEKANLYLAQLKAEFPKADTIYEDAIVATLGREALRLLRESQLIELCAVIDGIRLYAI